MPPWLAGISYVAAVALALSEVSMWITLAFTARVLLISGILLTRSQRIEELRVGKV